MNNICYLKDIWWAWRFGSWCSSCHHVIFVTVFTNCLTGLPVEVTTVRIESVMLSMLYATKRTLGTNSSPETISMKIWLYKIRRLKKGFVSKYEYRSRKYICAGRTHHARLHLAPVEHRNYADLELSWRPMSSDVPWRPDERRGSRNHSWLGGAVLTWPRLTPSSRVHVWGT